MWAKGVGKDEKEGRIQPPVLLNFRGHPRSQHCSLSSAGVLQGHHFFALSLFFSSEDEHIWKALLIQGNEMPTSFSLKFFIVVLFVFKYNFLRCFFRVWWLPAPWSALTFHVCALAILSSLFFHFLEYVGYLHVNYMNYFLSFLFATVLQNCINTKTIMCWFALLPYWHGLFVALWFFSFFWLVCNEI